MSWFGGDGDEALLLKVLANQQRIETKLDTLLAAFDLQAAAPPPTAGPHGLTPSQREEIQAFMAAGRKIDAIKLLRELTGMSLSATKDAVESGAF